MNKRLFLSQVICFFYCSQWGGAGCETTHILGWQKHFCAVWFFGVFWPDNLTEIKKASFKIYWHTSTTFSHYMLSTVPYPDWWVSHFNYSMSDQSDELIWRHCACFLSLIQSGRQRAACCKTACYKKHLIQHTSDSVDLTCHHLWQLCGLTTTMAVCTLRRFWQKFISSLYVL